MKPECFAPDWQKFSNKLPIVGNTILLKLPALRVGTVDNTNHFGAKIIIVFGPDRYYPQEIKDSYEWSYILGDDGEPIR